MNIVQLHDRVRFWVDSVASTRFEAADIDQGINNAVREITNEKYDHSQRNHNADTFERTQRVRDELSNLVVPIDTDGTLSLIKRNGHVAVQTFPTDYKYLLSIALHVYPDKYNAWPLTHDRENIIDRNPYRRVKESPLVKCYFKQNATELIIYHPFSLSVPTKVSISYLKDPTDSFYGYENGPADTIGLNIAFIASLSPTSYNGIEYVSGTALNTNGVTGVIDYGLAVTDYVNPEINGFLHEEVAKRAAANCLLTAV